MWTIDLDPRASTDLRHIHTYLGRSYIGFGESLPEAIANADRPLAEVDVLLARIVAGPFHGERHDDLFPGLRHLTIDRIVVWFKPDEDAEVLRVLGFFFGGEDHLGKMIQRRTGDH